MGLTTHLFRGLTLVGLCYAVVCNVCTLIPMLRMNIVHALPLFPLWPLVSGIGLCRYIRKAKAANVFMDNDLNSFLRQRVSKSARVAFYLMFVFSFIMMAEATLTLPGIPTKRQGKLYTANHGELQGPMTDRQFRRAQAKLARLALSTMIAFFTMSALMWFYEPPPDEMKRKPSPC